MFDMKPKLNTCLCYKKFNDSTFIPLIGTMTNRSAQRPVQPCLASLSLIQHQCVQSLQSPASPPACLFHTAYVASLFQPCHCLTTHIKPSCHFAQDADGVVCVCLRVGCVQNISAAFDIFVHQLHLQEGDAGVLVLYKHVFVCTPQNLPIYL